MDDLDWKLRMERKMGVLEEQGRWTAKQLHDIGSKQDTLIESHTKFKTRVATQTSVIGAVVALAVSFFGWMLGR